MKLNLTIKATKNYQTVELTAENMDLTNFDSDRNWLIMKAQEALEIMVPGENYSQKPAQIVTYTDSVPTQKTEYQAATQPKGAPASQKQINFLRSLGYQDDVTDLSVTEANNLIKQLKPRNIK